MLTKKRMGKRGRIRNGEFWQLMQVLGFCVRVVAPEEALQHSKHVCIKPILWTKTIISHQLSPHISSPLYNLVLYHVLLWNKNISQRKTNFNSTIEKHFFFFIFYFYVPMGRQINLQKLKIHSHFKLFCFWGHILIKTLLAFRKKKKE